jgi:hypothetical protein
MGAFRRRSRHFAQLMTLTIGVALLSGCGSDSGSGSTNAGTTTAPSLDPTSAENVVRDYYAAIGNQGYGQAWRFLGPQQRHEDQGFRTWKSGYASTVRTTLGRDTAAVLDSDTAKVGVTLKTVDEYACDNRVLRTFKGAWTVDFVGGAPLLDGAAISETGTTQLPSNCPPPPPPAVSAPPPTSSEPPASSSNCDPSYPDQCLQDGIGDYDCAGGSGNGPNYVSGPVTVTGSDPFGLDADGDGVGCESY